MQQTLPINTQAIAEILKDHCHTYIMPLHNNLSPSQIHKKGNGKDIVTDADEQMEKYLSQTLQQYLPNSTTLGEEAYAKNPDIAKTLESDQFIWIIDPLDGTRNFMNGRKEFCSMISLVKNHTTIAAWIYLPLEDKMLIADHINKAYDDKNNPIKINQKQHAELHSENMIGQINFGLFDENTRQQKRTIAENTYKNLDRIFCVGYDFSGMCLGRRHFSAYRFLWWWDHTPGAFILQQAGGVIQQIGNEAYSPTRPANHLIAAVTQDIADEITTFINNPPKLKSPSPSKSAA